MEKRHLTLLQKTVFAVIVVALPLIITFLYNYKKNTEYIKGETLVDLANTELVYEGLIYQFFEKAENRVQDFSSDGYIRDGTQKILEGQKSSVETLSDYISRNKLILDKTINAISIISLDGKVLTSTNISTIGNDFSSEEFFLRGKNNISVAVSGNDTSGLIEIVASAPLKNISTGMPIGVIVNSIHVLELSKVLENVMNTINVYLVDYNKKFITKPIFDRNILLNQKIDTLPINKCIKSNENFIGFYKDYRNVDVAGASVCLPEMKWVLLIETDANTILEHTKKIGRNILTTAFLVAGIIGALFIAFYEKVVKQIRKISVGAEKITGGNYNITIPIESGDEIGILSRSFNKMASEINRRTNELEESSKKLKEAHHIARLGNWEWDIVKDKLRWSDEIYSIFGGEVGGFDDARFLNFVHPDDRELVKSTVHEALYNKKPYSIDYRIVLKGGKEKIVHEQGVVALNTTGEPVRMVGTIQDITEQRRLEKSKLEIQQRYEELINSLNAGVFKIGTDGKMIEVNKACVMMAEADSREELLKKNVLDLLENKGKLKEIIDKLLKGESVVDEEIPFITIKGNKIWTSVSTVLKKDDKGNIYLEGIIEEITEKKKLEDQLKHSQKMEAVGILAGGIAHDFNNILSAIMNYGSLLIMKKGGDETTKKFAEQIISASEKGASLTRGILTFSRKQVMNLQVADLNELVRKIEKILLRLIGEDIELKVNLTDKTLTMNIDEIQIDHVLMNLATNARDALQKGGIITITTNITEIDSEFIRIFGYGELGKYALISFSDNGVGMDDETRKRIFEPFFTTKGVGKGTGLGLSMSYGIVKQHNGFIDVFSEPNKGTEFKIYLPLTDKRVEGKKSVEVAAPVVRGTETLLLAEDNSVVRETARAILEEYGYKVVEAVDGEDTVKKFIENMDSIKLIVSDMVMPKKSGKEAYEEIKKISPDMKVLFISGYAPDLLKDKALHENGIDFIIKPVVPDNLLRKVREAIDSPNNPKFGLKA